MTLEVLTSSLQHVDFSVSLVLRVLDAEYVGEIRPSKLSSWRGQLGDTSSSSVIVHFVFVRRHSFASAAAGQKSHPLRVIFILVCMPFLVFGILRTCHLIFANTIIINIIKPSTSATSL